MTDDRAAFCTVARVRNPRSEDRRRGVKAAAVLAAGAVTVNVAAWGLLSALFPGLHLLPHSPAAQVSRPTPTPTAQVADRATPTPADVALDAVAHRRARTLFGPGWRAQPATETLYGSPFSHACGAELPDPAAPAVARGRTARSARDGVTLQLWAYGAGQASAAAAALRTQLDACTGRDGIDPYTYTHTLHGATGFVAVADAAGQGITWLIWQRGDVLAALSYTTLHGATVSPADAVAGRVDTALVRALRPVCPTLTPAAGDGTRNPYVPGYRPYSRDVVVDAPTFPDVPVPDAPAPTELLTAPDPVAHPELAPPLPPDPAAYLDLDGDGFAETPPPLEQAPLGPAPVFADPAAFTVPVDALTVAPTAPPPPPAPAGPVTAHLPLADVTGPGCGWAFTGQPVPHFDTATLRDRGHAALRDALAAQTAAAARYRAAQVTWASEYVTWQDLQARYEAYRRLVAAQQQAQADAAAAQTAYDTAVAAYTDPLTPPGPDPTTDPTAGPSATPDPTPSADPTPTPDPTVPPSTDPTPTVPPTSQEGP